MVKWCILGVFVFFWLLGKPIFNAMVDKDYNTMASTFTEEREFRKEAYYGNNNVEDWSDPFNK